MRKSINKTTVIIVLAIFLSISVGYALFSDTITIEGTATAQGNFDIEPTCYVEIPDNIKEGITNDWTEDGNKDASCSIKDNTVSYSVSLDYPGSNKYFVIQFKNTGSIIASASATTIEEGLLKNKVNVYNSNTNELVETLELSEGNLFLSVVTIAFGGIDGSIYDDNTDEFSQMIDYESVAYKIEPNQSFYLVLEANWLDREEYTQDGVYYEIAQTVTLPWQQYTQ